MAESNLSAERARELLHYDPETGNFTWSDRALKKSMVGKPAGTTKCYDPSGKAYLRITIGGANGGRYRGHRLAWLYVHGEWPAGQIDHKNGDKLDNRIDNLRDVTCSVNAQNRRKPHRKTGTGLLGVCWKGSNCQSRPFVAAIGVGGRVKHLGAFATAEEAHAAYLAAKRQLHEGCTL